jgi:hypothetical protein
LDHDEVVRFQNDVRHGDRHSMPGAVRASCGINTTDEDVHQLLDAVAIIASGAAPPCDYQQDPASGDYFPESTNGRLVDVRSRGGLCSPG